MLTTGINDEAMPVASETLYTDADDNLVAEGDPRAVKLFVRKGTSPEPGAMRRLGLKELPKAGDLSRAGARDEDAKDAATRGIKTAEDVPDNIEGGKGDARAGDAAKDAAKDATASAPDFDAMTKADLLEHADAHGIEVDRSAHKADLLAAVKKATK
jgi:hypothetical protein